MVKKYKKYIWSLVAIIGLALVYLGGCFWLDCDLFLSESTNKVLVNENVAVVDSIETTTTTQVEYFSSFSDSFSGTAWLDIDKTNLYRDGSAMVLTFPPRLEWQNQGDCQEQLSDCQNIDRFLADLNSQKLCHQNDCLQISQDKLIYNSRSLAWPGHLPLINAYINRFGDRWLVAGVRKIDDKQYQPLAWWFDGRDFQSINLPGKNSQLAKSEYLGQFGAGGSSGSLLILYSAYEGLAWQVEGGQVHDLSHLWGIRVNGGGFASAIVSIGQGNKTNWYVFNRGRGTPRWLKLWQNNTEWIEGVLDLSDSLPAGVPSISFLPISDSQPKFLAKIVMADGQQQLWSFKDKGFDISQSVYQVYSADLTAYDRRPSQITRAAVVNPAGGWSGLKNGWFLSPDQQQWLAVDPGQMIVFSTTTSQLWWRWQVKPTQDNYQSPCLKIINLNYYRL